MTFLDPHQHRAQARELWCGGRRRGCLGRSGLRHRLALLSNGQRCPKGKSKRRKQRRSNQAAERVTSMQRRVHNRPSSSESINFRSVRVETQPPVPPAPFDCSAINRQTIDQSQLSFEQGLLVKNRPSYTMRIGEHLEPILARNCHERHPGSLRHADRERRRRRHRDDDRRADRG